MNVHSGGPVGLTALVAVMLTGCQRAEPPKPALEGAWSIASIRVTGPDSAANTTVQPSVYLFGHTHYSMMRVTGNQPRALAASDRVTDAEKIRAYDSFVANSGTYEIADSTLTTHPTVARSPNFMSGGSDRYAFRVSGDTLWLSNTGADLRTRIGGQLVSPRTTTGTTTLVLVRQK